MADIMTGTQMGIQTGIQLADNFSAPMMNVIRATNLAIAAFDDLGESADVGIDTASLMVARSELAQAAAQTQQMINPTEQIGNAIEQNVRGQQEFNQSLQSGAGSAATLFNRVKQTVAAYVTMQTVKGVLNASDELTQTMSRLNLMNDGLQDTAELYHMVYEAAQDARGSVSDMASVVARFGNNAGDAFGSSAEVVQFANLIQKQMTIAGASTQEAANAQLQLSQALGSGVLRGDELNSIYEQAPNLIQNIADYLDVPIGKIREMAAEGELTADVVKNAIFDASEEINENFENMPVTWGQAWTSFQNMALSAFEPVLQEINAAANSDEFQTMMENAGNALVFMANITMDVFDLLGEGAAFVQENWSYISPVLYGAAAAAAAYAVVMGVLKAQTMAAAAAEFVFSGAILACPLTWIIAAIGALAVALYAVNRHFSATGQAAQTTFGRICGGVWVAGAAVKNFGLLVLNVMSGIIAASATTGLNMKAAFNNTISGIQALFYALLSTACSVIGGICTALNALPFVEFDYSGIVSAADSYAAKASAAAGQHADYASIGDAFRLGMNTYEYESYADAYAKGAAWGDSKTSALTGANQAAAQYDFSNLTVGDAAAVTADNTADTAKNTASMADALATTNEDLKYLRDLAERESVNRFTTAEINVEMVNNNTINDDKDLDGISEHLRSKIEQEMQAAAEGEH